MRTSFALMLWLSACGAALADGVCRLDPDAAPVAPRLFPGVVRGLASAQEIAAQTAIAVARVHAPMNPKYADLPRVFVYFEMDGARHGVIAAVLDGAAPDPGDKVVVASRRRDPASPCAFIPWTVIRGAPGKSTV